MSEWIKGGAAMAVAALLLGVGAMPVRAGDTSAAAQLARWQQAAGMPAHAARGQAFFNQRHGGEWSCASCHGQPPTQAARHAATGKSIAALAPAFNTERFADSVKTDKWFRRNCKDVLARECTAAEKADVMAYLLSLRP